MDRVSIVLQMAGSMKEDDLMINFQEMVNYLTKREES